MSRRDFIKSSSVVALGVTVWGCGPDKKPLDVLLKGGVVFQSGRYQKSDIGLRDGIITTIEPTITLSPEDSPQIIDCKDMYICPGWVDLHVHIGQIGMEVKRLGAPMGVTALVDAGTYGPQTFPTFLDSFVKGSETPIYSLLNLRKDGITFSNTISGPKHGPGVEDVAGAEKLVEAHPTLIKGFKVRTDGSNTSKEDPLFMARITSELATKLKLPVMYHLGTPPPSLLELLPYTKKGDIITHFLRKKDNNILDGSGKVYPEVIKARKNGVIFDVGHGVTSFVFEALTQSLQQGFTDFTISSDVWRFSASSKAYTLANVMSKCLALGLTLEDITQKASVLPRTLLGLPHELAAQQSTDLTVFSIAKGKHTFDDANGKKQEGEQRIFPEYSVIRGKVIRAGDTDRELFL